VKLRTAYTPEPLNGTFCGLPPPLSLTLTDAVLAPLAVGLKLTEMVQLAPAATAVPQLFVWLKSPGLVPLILMDEIESDVAPLLVSLTVFAAVFVPTLTEPKLKDVGLSCTTVPIPVKAIV